MSSNGQFTTNINNTYVINNDAELQQSQKKIEEYEGQIEQLERDLNSANATADKLRSTINSLNDTIDSIKDRTGFTELEEQLQQFQLMAERAGSELEAHFKSFRILGDDRDIQLEFDRLKDEVEKGTKTVDEAITEFKLRHPHLFEELLNNSGGADSKLLSEFYAALQRISEMVSSVSQQLSDMQEYGVKAVGSVSGGEGGGTGNALERIDAAARNLTEDAKESYQIINRILESVNAFASVDASKIFALSQTFKAMSDIGNGSYGKGKVENIIELASGLQKLSQNGGNIPRIEFEVKASKAALNNLATYLPIISNDVNYENLGRLQSVDFSNFQQLKVNRGSIQSIADLVNAINNLREQIYAPQQDVSGSILDPGALGETANGAEAAAESIRELANASDDMTVKFGANSGIQDIKDALASTGGIGNGNATKIANEFSDLEGRISSVSVKWRDFADVGRQVSKVTVSALDDMGAEFQRIIDLRWKLDEDGNIVPTPDMIHSGVARVKYDLAEQYKAASAAVKEYYALLNQVRTIDQKSDRWADTVKALEEAKQRMEELTSEESQEKMLAEQRLALAQQIAAAERNAGIKENKIADAQDAKSAAEHYRDVANAVKDYYALLQDMAKPGTDSQYFRQNVEEQNGSFVAKAEDVREYVNQLNAAKTAMESYLSTLSADNSTEKQRKDLEALIDTMEKRHDLMMETASRADAERAQKEENRVYEEANQLLKEMIQLREQYGNKLKVRASEAFGNNEKNIEELRMLVASGAPIDEIVAKLKEMRVATDENGQSMRSLGSSAKSTFSGMMRYMAMTFSSYRLIMMTVREIKKMISTSIELDSAMTQMQIVTKASDATMRQFGQTAAQVAKETATSISDVIDSATVFARLGYSLDESAILSKYTGMLQRVGNIDVSDAQDAITAIIKAYDIDANDIESVMDRLVEVGNNFPISVEQIAEGMNNAAASLSAAGNSFEESVALLTAANTIVQNASKASTGLRTIAARLRNTKAELDELGEEPIATPKYEELVKQLTDYNVSLLDAAGNYRSTYEIMRDLARVWNDIPTNIQAAITTALAGTRQQAIFNSIISQFQEASGAMDAMADSAGALGDAYNTYMDSTQAHIDQFKAAFQELSQTAIDSGFVSDVVDKGTALINLLTKLSGFVEVIGGLRTTLTALIGTIVTFKITQWLQNIQRVGRAIKALITDHERFGQMLKNNKASWTSFWFGMATIAITAISAITSAIKKKREEALMQTKEGFDAAYKDATDRSAVIDTFESYANARLAIDDSIESKAKLTQSTLELSKALGVEASAIGGTRKELEKLSKLELEEAIRKADEAVAAAQAVLFGDTSTGFGASNEQLTVRKYAVGYFQKHAEASGYTRLWDGMWEHYAEDFAAWFESADPKRRIDAIKSVYKYMQDALSEMYAASSDNSDILTSTEYTNLLKAVNFLKTDIDALEDAEDLLTERHKQYERIVEKLEAAAKRSSESSDGAAKSLTEYGESAKLVADSLSESWDLEDFAKTREELAKLTKEVNGITPDKIIELAKESDVLSFILRQDGMDARFLAHVLQTELTGGDGFGLITEQALMLNDALNGLSDEFDHLANSKAKYDANKSGPEVDDEFKSMAEAYKSLSEEFEKGRVGSNAFWNSAEYLFGAEQLEEWEFSADRVREAMEQNKVVFEDADSAGAGFLTRLKELSDANGDIVGEDGGILASIQQLADGTIEFNVDDLRLDELAKKLGISRDAIIACSKALRAFGRIDMTDMGQVLNAMNEIGLGADFNGTSIVNAVEAYDMLRNTLGYNAKEAHDVMDGLEAMGVTLINLNAPVDQLAQQFAALGVAEESAGGFTVNIDGLIGLMQQLQLTDEQAAQLVTSLGEANNISLVDAKGDAESLDDALKKVNKASFKSAKDAAGGLSKELDISKMSAEELYKELNKLVKTNYTIQMDRRQLEDAYRRALELRNLLNGASPSGPREDSRGYPSSHGAHGITNAAPGATLVGEEEPELWVQDGRAQLVGVHGPEIIETKAGDRIFKGSDTRKILKNVRFIRGTIPAMSYGGTVSIPGWSPSTGSTSSYSGGSSGSSGTSNSSSSSKKGESVFEKEYKRHQHLLKMEAETQREYLTWLNDAYKKAYNNNQIELEDYWKYEEEVYSGMKDLFMDYLNDIEHEIDMIGEDKSRVNRVVELYTTAVKSVEKEIAAARKAGLKDTDEYIQQLQKKIKDYREALTSMREDARKEVDESEQELVDLRIKMIKQEIDDRKDGLNKQLSDLKDFYQKQKDMLRDSRDEEKYLDDQAEKRKKVADIERELSALQRDNSAWAAKRRLELEEDLADARKELREFEKDHAIEMAQEELDRIAEIREDEINAQIEDLENITPHEIYEQALHDIRNATNELFNESVEWNNVYGDGIEKNIIDKWDRARAAFENYWNTVRALGSDGNSTVMRFASGFRRPVQSIGVPLSTRLGYASGTFNAAPGFSMLDEFGTETIFQSKTGKKYKMFTGGEKVLNAKASEFLYKFATSGGEFLSKLVNGASNSFNYLTGGGRRLAVEAVNMGDIVINGNADQSTVSEIRRAQRDALENLLREFDRLSK